MKLFKNTINPLFIVVVIAFLIRLLILAIYPDSFYNSARLLTHLSIADNIVSKNVIAIDDKFVLNAGKYINEKNRIVDYLELKRNFSTNILNYSPDITDTWGMAYLTAFFWWITDSRSYIPIQLFQILLDSITIYPLFSIVFLLLRNKKIGYISSIVYSLFPPFIFLSATLNRDLYATWGIVWSTYFFLSWMLENRKNNWRVIVAALIICSTLWFRTTVMFVPFIWVLFYLLFEKLTKASLKTSFILIIVIFSLEFILFIYPFSLQFHQKYNLYNFSSGLNGGVFWTGLGEFSKKYHFICNDDSAMSRAVQLGYPKDATMYTPEFSRLLKEDAFKVVTKDPLFLVEVIVKRYCYFFFARPPFGVSERSNIHFARMNLPISDFVRRYPLETIELVVKAIVALLLPICSLLLIWFRRNEWKQILLLILLWQYPLIVHLPTHLENRYVVPHLFALIIATSCFGYYLHRKLVHKISFNQP